MKLHAAQCLVLCTLIWQSSAQGVEVLELRTGSVSGPGWQAAGVRARIEPLAGNRLAARVEIDHVSFVGSPHVVEKLAIHCPSLAMDVDAVGCASATVSGQFPFVGGQRVEATLTYGHQSGELSFALSKLAAAHGLLEAVGALSRSGWELTVTAADVDCDALTSMLSAAVQIEPAFHVFGTLSAKLTLRATPGEAPVVSGRISLRAVSASNSDGTFATEAVDAELSGRMDYSGTAWNFELALVPERGQLYVEPVFMDLENHAFDFSMNGSWQPEAKRLSLDSFRFSQPGVGAASGRLVLGLEQDWRILEGAGAISGAVLPGAYAVYLAPFLFGTPLDALETTGSFDAQIAIEDDDLTELEVTPHDVFVDDKNKRFAVYALNGRLRWQASESPDDAGNLQQSRLSWAGGLVYGLRTGAGDVRFVTHGPNFVLGDPVRLPVLDGALMVHELSLVNTGTPDMRMAFDAALEPIGLRELTAALNWPSFSGTLSGTLPRLSYEGGEMTFGGQLEARVFGGTISVQHLRITEPFGTVPQLTADILLDGLDLQAVTETFSFGRVTGLLEGEIRHLHMVDWSPAAFDARLGTPRNDATRRRISQRAIEDISSLAGQGATAALSSGFLRFFQDFAYSEIGLSCRLENDVCFMSGIDPREDRYYIVKGQGLPRIDVIGHAHRVAWPVLIDRLASIRYEDAVIE